MKKLEENDIAEQSEAGFSPEAILKTLKQLQERKTELNEWRDRIEANGGVEIAIVDSDCRMMKQGGNARPLDASYNIQTVVDGKNKLIVDFDVTNCPDEKGALYQMTESAKEIMEVKEIIALGDKGYYDPEDIAKCEHNGTICYVANMISGVRAPNPEFDHEAFRYDKDSDYYICPMGAVLPFKRVKKSGKLIGRKYHNSAACYKCPNHTKCTKGWIPLFVGNEHIVNSGENHPYDGNNGSFFTSPFAKAFVFDFVVRSLIRFHGCICKS